MNIDSDQTPSSNISEMYNNAKEYASNISGYWIAIIIIGIIAIIAIILGSMYINDTYRTKVLALPVTSVPAYYTIGVMPPSGQYWNNVGQMTFDKGYWQVNIYSYIFDKVNTSDKTPSVFLNNYSVGLGTIDGENITYINGSGLAPWASQTNGTGWVKFQPSDAITNYWNMQIPSSTIFVNTNKTVNYSLISMALFTLNGDTPATTYESPFQVSIQARAIRISKSISTKDIPYSS